MTQSSPNPPKPQTAPYGEVTATPQRPLLGEAPGVAWSLEKRLPRLKTADWLNLPSPCYLIDETLLLQNLELLAQVRAQTGCKILLAQKAYSAYQTYPLIGRYLDGTTASGLYEAKLGAEAMPGQEVHVFSPAFTAAELEEILPLADHLVFNSWSQWLQHRLAVRTEQRRREETGAQPLSCGLRINPGYSEVETALYDPCALGSRLGVPASAFWEGWQQGWFEGLEGLHFHCLCEQDADVLARVWQAFKTQFNSVFPHLKWVNLGGGHHITRAGYQFEQLFEVIREAQQFGLTVYLEPGEAVALDTGFLVTTVQDLVKNGMELALVDFSPTCHTPDVLEMPYRPRLFPIYSPDDALPLGLSWPDALQADPAAAQALREQARMLPLGLLAGLPADAESADDSPRANPVTFSYRFGGPTCLAGDVLGDYAFPAPLRPGDRLVLCDMAIYSFVKTSSFNGMPLPTLLYRRASGQIETLFEPRYEDFKNRL